MRLLLAHESETGVLRLVDEDEGTPPSSLSEPSHQYPTPLTTPSLGFDAYPEAQPENSVLANIERTSAQYNTEKLKRHPPGDHAEKGQVKFSIGNDDAHQQDDRFLPSSEATHSACKGTNAFTPKSEVDIQSCASERSTIDNFSLSASLGSHTIRGVKEWLRVRRLNYSSLQGSRPSPINETEGD